MLKIPWKILCGAAYVILFGMILVLHIANGYQPTNFEVLVTLAVLVLATQKDE